MEKVNHTKLTKESQTKTGKTYFEIDSKRLSSRKLELKDIDSYYQLFLDNPDLFRETSSEFFEKSEMQNIFSFWDLEKDKYCYVVFDKESRELIGDFNLIRYDFFKPREMEIR